METACLCHVTPLLHYITATLAAVTVSTCIPRLAYDSTIRIQPEVIIKSNIRHTIRHRSEYEMNIRHSSRSLHW